MDITHAEDLKKVYMFVYDNFACSTTDVADNITGINTRYARELLAVLQSANLITITESNEGDVWQAFPDTYDTMTSEEAVARITAWLSENVAAPPPATSTGSRSSLKSGATGPHPCGCGCGETITTRAVYRPGHDARHAGQVGRAIAEEAASNPSTSIEDADSYTALPSGNLTAKAMRIAANHYAKITKAAKPEPTCVEGTVKVGKNEVVARKWSGGTVEYLPANGQSEWKPASAAATRTFQEG